MTTDTTKIIVIGLGYVGLPLAIELSKHFPVTGFDINKEKMATLAAGTDPCGEVASDELKNSSITFTSEPATIKEQDVIIVCVPTPIDEARKPDLFYVKSASELVGKHMKKGSTVIYESTVYPGVTEEVCLPILEKESGLKLGAFSIGYSPERINPGDHEHTIDKVVKIVAGNDPAALDKVDSVYSKITTTHRASSIRVGEAAKVIENIQRDLNIALMNELQIIFDKMEIPIHDVLAAAGTKWNFHPYRPGLVGGHCIGVDPYYLTYKAESVGHHPEVILAGRRINDTMHEFYAEKIILALAKEGIALKESRVLLLGMTFKPDVKDARNSRVKQLIERLQQYGITVEGCEPNLDDETVKRVFNVQNHPVDQLPDADLVFLAVKHREFAAMEKPKGLFLELNKVGG
jgi:UDP-N-acetyl-D-galactosamine dehydrogenase